jgi:hypothetical protein
MAAKKHTAPEIIGTHLGWDMRKVKDGRYQPSRFPWPSVYECGHDYFCAPSGSQTPRILGSGGKRRRILRPSRLSGEGA